MKTTADPLVLLNVEVPLSLRRRARLMAASQDTTIRHLVCSSLEQLIISWETASQHIPATGTEEVLPVHPPAEGEGEGVLPDSRPVIDTDGVLRNPSPDDPPFTIDGTFRDIDPNWHSELP